MTQLGTPDGISSAPRPRSYTGPAQCSGAHLLIAVPIRDQNLQTAFRSPATTGHFWPAIPRSSFPACLSGYPPIFHRTRSASATLYVPVARSVPDRITPVARFPTGSSGLVPGLHSPLGVFMPLWIEAFNQNRCPMVHPRGPPDFPSLPGTATFYGYRTGSTFQARYVPRGSLFPEPLGTIYIME
jgi:hypothetical protein